jgi:glycosyltransferase involved in cell wall biosynthesis
VPLCQKALQYGIGGIKAMKIAILSFYSGEVSRGVESYVHELANHLTKLGHQITVYQNGKQRAEAKYRTETIGLNVDWNKQQGGIPFVNYYSLLIKSFTEKSLQRISKETDMVLTTSGQWQSVLVRKWTGRRGVKHVISGQSGPGRDDRINLACTPDSFVALTEYQKQWAIRAVPFLKNRVDKIPNGVDIKKFGSAKPVKVDLPRPIVLNVAALEDWKGQHLAIKAVSEMKEGSLVLVGKGIEKESLEKMGNKLLPGRFLLMELPYEEMPKIYKAADLFTFPTSPWESFGIVMLEAMAAGLPVVASNDPIRREIVGDAGIFVNPLDTEDYARALQKAVDTKWGTKPLKQAEKFSWDNIAKQYEDLFYDLIK